jgi:hypothetical protein
MNTREVTAIAIKLLAIWLLVHVIVYIPSLALAFTGLQDFNQTELPQWLYYALVASSLIIGFLAAILLMRTSNSVLTSTSTELTASNIDQTFLLQLAGIFFIVTALAGLPGILLNLGEVSTVQTDIIFYLGGKLFKLGVGLYLLIKPAVWTRLLNKLRGR